MSSPDFQRSIDAFAHAHGLADEAERAAYLDELGRESPALRREVESLLAERSLPGAAEASPLDAGGGALPEVPGYELVAELGSGGFGTVYAARRVASGLGDVAVKVLHGGVRSGALVERFHRERELHAEVDSPYVARVLDAGTTAAGAPFLVVELVAGGRTLLEHAEAERLSVPARLRLFALVCEGVEHLHRVGIVHRDLKPSNVLVTGTGADARPKVIDFGLAKREQEDQGLTQAGVRVGTPRYMSPEQREGARVDARTDVYALGVLLHELLAGLPPEPSGPSAETTRRPSSRLAALPQAGDLARARGLRGARQLERALAGDLDAILQQCLCVDPAERYQSVHELRADLARHLAHEPVLARGRSGLYALGRLARRHPVASGAVAGGVAALLAGVVVASGALAQQREANRELERIAAYERERLASLDPAAMRPVLRAELLEQARLGLEQRHGAEAPERLAAFQAVLDNTSLTSVALAALREGVFGGAREQIDAGFAESPLLRARMLLELSNHMAAAGLLELAHQPAADAYALRAELLGPDRAETLDAGAALGNVLRKLGRHDEARVLLDELVARATAALGPTHRQTLSLRQDRVGIDLAEMDGATAAPQLEELYELFREAFGPDHAQTNRVVSAIAMARTQNGDAAGALRWSREAYASAERRLGPDAVGTHQAGYNLGLALLRAGENEEAAAVVRRAYDGLYRAGGREHPYTLQAATLLSQVLIQEGELEEATRIVRSSLETTEALYGPSNHSTILALANLAQVLRLGGRHAEACREGDEAVARARAVLPADSQLLGSLLVDHARTLGAAARVEEARAIASEGRALLAARLGEDNDEVRAADEVLGDLVTR